MYTLQLRCETMPTHNVKPCQYVYLATQMTKGSAHVKIANILIYCSVSILGSMHRLPSHAWHGFTWHACEGSAWILGTLIVVEENHIQLLMAYQSARLQLERGGRYFTWKYR